jgi:hypothetical protein
MKSFVKERYSFPPELLLVSSIKRGGGEERKKDTIADFKIE